VVAVDEEIEVLVTTNKQCYSVAEEVHISLTIKNNGAKSLELVFVSAQRYDIAINFGNKEIWRWSKDKMFALFTGKIVLKPGKKQTYTATWKTEGASVGKYDVIGTITSKPTLSNKTSIEIAT